MTAPSPVVRLGLAGRAALVTGAASGIGKATAILLAANGATVIACDRDIEGLAATMRGLSGTGHIAEAVDIGDMAKATAMVERTVGRFQRLDILMNVAAVLRRLDIEEIDEEEWRRLFDVNLKSQFFLCRAVGEAMKRRRWGRIVNFSSGAGLVGGYIGATVYAMTKGGNIALTKSFAKEFGAFGICVNTISPGSIDTPMQRTGMTAANLEAARARIPLGRMGDPMEVARAAVFLASDMGSYITGHVLAVDGGFLMR
jgi:3-oxoacyl-[acyl-carrier protein] reductase